MSRAPIDEKSKTIYTGRGKEFNEFERIEGLGPVVRRWLRESFNVKTLEDLARLSVNRVLANPTLSRLEDKGKAVSC